MATTMEKLQQINQTLSDIDDRVPDALRVALGLGHRVSPTPPGPGEDDNIANFAASLLQPPATEDGTDDRGPTEPDAAASAPRIDWGSCYVPRPDHDAHFGNAKASVFGVADGVGGYAKSGVDAGAFSRGLMASASAEVAGSEPGAHVCPYALLERAYDKTAASGAPGASTSMAVILLLAGNTLEWAYIGDSTFAVLRSGKIVSASTPQRHLSRTAAPREQSFASAPPPPGGHISSGSTTRRSSSAPKPNASDSVSNALVGQLAVRAGDVVVLGTDVM